MNSSTLKEKGFKEFTSIKSLTFSSIPADKSGVIILIDSTITGKNPSDILYIGKSKKPAKRIFGGYLAGYGSKSSRKIHSMLTKDGCMEKVSVSWMESDKPKVAQQALLENFKKEHGKYPAWNTPKKPVQKPKPVAAAKPVKKKPAQKPKPKTVP
ncbi:MAG: hypothetical protein NWF01_08250 [Candidatus Bathyarchaeota archaeon]|nr:hypothetical protein [Candidatus Bathyarchaeota archaeon]